MPSIFEGESHTPKIKQINVYLTRFWTLTLMLQQFRYANLFYFRYSKTCFQIDFISFMVSFEKSLYIKMMVFFRILLNYLKYVIFKSVKSTNNDTWSVPILACLFYEALFCDIFQFLHHYLMIFRIFHSQVSDVSLGSFSGSVL